MGFLLIAPSRQTELGKVNFELSLFTGGRKAAENGNLKKTSRLARGLFVRSVSPQAMGKG